MGCKGTKVLSVSDTTAGQAGKAKSEGHLLTFTELQCDVLNSTWPIIAQDMTANGGSVLIDAFSAEPSVKKVFSFRDVPADVLEQHPAFQAHALRFMQVIESLALQASDNAVPDSEALLMLGAKHATIPGFEPAYLNTFVKCLHHTWEFVLGEEYTEEVREVWGLVFEHMCNTIRAGYSIYMDDMDNESQTAISEDLIEES